MPKSNHAHPRRHKNSHSKRSKKPPPRKLKPQRYKPRDSKVDPSASSLQTIPALQLDLGAHLTAFLKGLPLNKLARLTRLVERASKKITPLRLVTAGLLLISQAHISLTVWAVLLGLLSHKTISKQGVFERLDQAAVDFFKYSWTLSMVCPGTEIAALRAARRAWTCVTVTEPSSRSSPSRAET